MEDEIYGEFRLRLGHDITMFNYWRLKFILDKSMDEREIFRYCVNLTISTFKEDAEKGLTHMKILMQIYEPPFTKENKEDNDASMRKSLEDKEESSRRF